MPNESNISNNNPGLFRIIAAITYDLLVIFCLLILSITFLLFTLGLFNIDINNSDIIYNISHGIYFRLYLFSIILAYYHICWSYCPNNQTIGMRSWKLTLINNKSKSSKISITQSILRIVGGVIGFIIFGLGYIILYFNKNKLTLSDYISKTKISKLI